MISNAALCHVCGGSNLWEVAGFRSLPRITSDCRSFRAGGFLCVCRQCGAVQKAVTPQWLEEIATIYSGYASYYQSGGDEQIVFDARSGQPRRRSDVLIERLLTLDRLTQTGRAIDIGCGNGVTLSAFGRILPGWRLSGYEIDNSTLPQLELVPSFERLYTASLANIDRQFDLVTMVHSLEHFPNPEEALKIIGSRICGHHLFVEVCNVDENPFDILVADHLIHFSPATLARIIERAGLTVASVATDWVAKEISLLAQRGGAGKHNSNMLLYSGRDPEVVFARIGDYVRWLQELRHTALASANASPSFGIFGTSIAATWLSPQLSGKVSFFVDEDTSRIGREHLGCPVISPDDVPQDAAVFLALAPGVAQAVLKRLQELPCKFIPPPSLA